MIFLVMVLFNDHRQLINSCYSYLFKFSTKYTMWNTGMNEAQVGTKPAGKNINKLRQADDTTLMTEREEELKNLLMKVTEKSEKAGLKLNIQNTKIMAFCPIMSKQIDGKKWKQWQILFSWTPKSLQILSAVMKLKDIYSLERKSWHT